ncbi:MAG TPA: inositol monophosphatase family protein [Armatimonadota bacterium]|jgi:fructose-1,6-bisphosphatase/inositol monophosphatase family enzyme
MRDTKAGIELVKGLVTEAGKRALERCGAVGCERKSDESLVTEVDRDTELFLEERLKAAYPDFAFLGEEYGWRGPADAPVWCCDPIDGTTNYVFGLPHWCVSVGLVHQGVPLLGALYVPRLDELFWAVRGQGAFCNGVPLRCVDRDEPAAEDTVCLASPPLKTLNVSEAKGILRALGSIAIEVAYTGRGNLCAAIGQGEGILDVAAALCILFEAGGEFRHLSGPKVDIDAWVRSHHTPYRKDKPHLLYGPPRMLKHLQGTLKPL